jgi:hypothetical protein
MAAAPRFDELALKYVLSEEGDELYALSEQAANGQFL